MKKKFIILFSILLIILIIILTFKCLFKSKNAININKMEAMILETNDSNFTIQDDKNIIYTFKHNKMEAKIGDYIIIKYTGVLDKNTTPQDIQVLDYKLEPTLNDESFNPTWDDSGIFSDYYTMAYNKLKQLSLDEKIGQLFLVRYPDNNAIEALKKYHFSGFVFFEKDFKDKTKAEVQNMINQLQKNSTIPLLTAVDEEGGKVVRVSSNSNLVNEKFKSSQELYSIGGFETIKEDTINKSKILYNLGLNLNLAPVVDVSTNPDDYIYERTIGQNTNITSTYAKTVIEASKETNVSYTLKHFPGYGNNTNTHTGTSTDTRTIEELEEIDLPPFKIGIEAGAEAVLVSHNIVTSIDANNPASLSSSVHNYLRNEMGFTGIIITDNLDMNAISTIDNVTVKAILAGNDLIITTDYEQSIEDVKTAINNGTISEELIDKLAFRILAWKYYKGLMFETK